MFTLKVVVVFKMIWKIWLRMVLNDVVLNLNGNIMGRELVILFNSSPRKSLCESISSTTWSFVLSCISNSRQTLTLAGKSQN